MKKTKNEAPVIDISTADLRKGLGEIFDRVQYAGKRYVVSRKGRQIGAIVPIEVAQKLELLDQRRKDALARLTALLDAKPDPVADEASASKIASELVDEVRTKAASR